MYLVRRFNSTLNSDQIKKCKFVLHKKGKLKPVRELSKCEKLYWIGYGKQNHLKLFFVRLVSPS